MKNFLAGVQTIVVSVGIAIGAILAFGGDPFFGFFAEREERTFPICQRDLFSYLGDDLEWKQSISPVQSYEVVCGYVGGIAFDYGTITNERRVFEDGRLISIDTEIANATYTVECVRYINPPQKHHSKGWLPIDGDLFCEMPKQGVPPPRD